MYMIVNKKLVVDSKDEYWKIPKDTASHWKDKMERETIKKYYSKKKYEVKS